MSSLPAPPFRCPSDPSEIPRLRESTKSALLDILGSPPFDTPPPLDPVIMYSSDDQGYTRHKVRYGTPEDDVVWAWLLVPKGPAARRPAVICLPGSFMTPNYGRDGPAGLAGPLDPDHPEAYGRDLARLGYVTLCPDYPVAGERTTPGRPPYDTTDLDRRFPGWTRVGMSAWDVSRAVDFLCTRDEVDPGRIGVTGWSQGGQMSLIGAALEPRIAAVAPVCGWSPFRELPEDIVDNLVMPYNYPRLATHARKCRAPAIDLDHLALLIAPRPLLDLRADGDRYFPNTAAIREAERETAALYDLLDAGDQFRMYRFPGDHSHGPDAARETQAWFHRWLWRGCEADAGGMP